MAVSKFLEQIFLFLDLFNLKFYLEVLNLIFEETIREDKIKEKNGDGFKFCKNMIFFDMFSL